MVIYSATKHIDGQGRCLGGIVLSDEEFIEEAVAPYHKHTGPSLSPFNAWTLLKGLETLELRVNKQTETAGKIADALADAAGIARVIYPGRADHPQAALAKQQMKGGSTLVAFEIAGGQAETFAFLNRLELIDISNNLGDSKSLITHPTTTTHSSVSDELKAELGINENLLRLSVGLETTDDLIDDLVSALRG